MYPKSPKLRSAFGQMQELGPGQIWAITGTISIRISEASIESIVLVEDLVHDFPTFLEFIQSEVIGVEML